LGYTTIWLTGGPLDNLGQIAEVVDATDRARVATGSRSGDRFPAGAGAGGVYATARPRVAPGILSVDRFPSDDVAALYDELERSHPGRFVVGLGGAHGPNPLATLNAYF